MGLIVLVPFFTSQDLVVLIYRNLNLTFFLVLMIKRFSERLMEILYSAHLNI